MRPTLWLDVKRILGEAVDLPPEQRTAHVLASAADATVRDETLRLLADRERIAKATFGATPEPGCGAQRAGASPGDGGGARDGPRTPVEIRAGTTVGGRYELGERLGVGAFGAVHRATDRITGDVVAVKVVALAGRQETQALRREVAMLQRARLPGVVELLDEGTEGGYAFIVMRLIEGAPFPGALPGDPPSWRDVGPRALALVEALGRLHWLGVLHRDVKPENVVVTADGRVTIVDLGVAHDVASPTDGAPGCIVGTPSYLSPERFLGGPASVASDLYAVGVVLYETLSGRPARSCATLQDLLDQRDELLRPLGELAPDTPAHVAETIDALVHPDPLRRPATARIVAAMLRGQGAAGARVRLPWDDDHPPVPEAALRALFAGPDRLYHLQEDGARELWRRTLGRPADIAHEIEAWIDAGIARWEDDRIVIDRAGIERLETRLWSTLPPAAAAPRDFTPREYDVAAALEVAGCAVPVPAVARVVSRSVEDVRAALARLAADGLVRHDAEGAAEAAQSIDAAAGWSAERRRDAHAVVAAALPAASERRLFHLIAADAVDEVPSEAAAVGRRLHRDGRLDAAMLAASSGMTAARAAGSDPAVFDELLLLLVDAALAASSLEAIDRAAVELGRSPHDTPTLRTLVRTCAGARLVLLGNHARALAETEALEPGAPDDAERIRCVVRSFAAGLIADTELGRRVLAESFSWARRSGRKASHASAREWLGWRRYRQGRYGSAAWLHVRCAASQRTARARITALTNAASAYLESGDLARAAEFADRASRLAAEHRLPTHEARATWIRRAADYRSGETPAPDADLVAALQHGVAPVIAAVGLLVEAAICFRHGARADAAGVADETARLARSAAHAAVESIALGLAAAARGSLPPASVDRFIAQVQRVHVDALRHQALALFILSAPDAGRRLPESILRGVRLRPPGARAPRRHEVLSEVEWSEILEKVPGVPGPA